MPAGKFSCDGCGKSYSWKPELAGRRVKCKCGQTMSVPQDDAAGASDDGFDDLSALGQGASAAAGGPACPSCNSPVDVAAVICVNCGTNLKTGQKIKTRKAPAADPSDVMPGYRSYGAVATDEPMSEQKKKIVMFSCIGGILAVVIVIAAVIIPKAREKNRETAAKDAAARPVLEKVITASENAGGLTEAMKDGTLATAVSSVRPSRAAAANPRPDSLPFDEYHDRILNNPATKVAKKWILAENHHFVGKTHEDSARIVAELYETGSNSVKVIGVTPGDNDTEIATGVVAALPADPSARARIFVWMQSQKRVVHPLDLPPQTDVGQKCISVEYKE